jgi:fumarate hydratase, class II
LLDGEKSRLIQQAAQEIADGRWDEHFPIDIFQTGSGTSTNMNANEVIATRAAQIDGTDRPVHPNDHVNIGQSSNDVIPASIHLAAHLAIHEQLLPAMEHLQSTLEAKAAETKEIVKMGRTHLMDAMPVTVGQEVGGWAAQVKQSRDRIEATLPRLGQLALGGTAVGTGINAHPEFGERIADVLSRETGLDLREADNHFEAQAAQVFANLDEALLTRLVRLFVFHESLHNHHALTKYTAAAVGRFANCLERIDYMADLSGKPPNLRRAPAAPPLWTGCD